jgi:hypothetical protein
LICLVYWRSAVWEWEESGEEKVTATAAGEEWRSGKGTRRYSGLTAVEGGRLRVHIFYVIIREFDLLPHISLDFCV